MYTSTLNNFGVSICLESESMCAILFTQGSSIVESKHQSQPILEPLTEYNTIKAQFLMTTSSYHVWEEAVCALHVLKNKFSTHTTLTNLK